MLRILSFCLFAITISLFSCQVNRFAKYQTEFNQSEVIRTFKSIDDLNDDYFVIKENNYFEFYKQLFDSVKNTSIPGRYTMKGDTMLLEYFKKKDRMVLGSKAIIDNKKNEIIFFDHYPSPRRKLVVR